MRRTGKYDGVDVNSANGVQNAFENFVWEPLQVKLNVYTAAAEVLTNSSSASQIASFLSFRLLAQSSP
jgi:chaperonin GroEL (HSP60 family)